MSQFGAINMLMIERLEKARISRHEDIARDVKIHEGWKFETPKYSNVVIKGQIEMNKFFSAWVLIRSR
jgi:hypothetical protein